LRTRLRVQRAPGIPRALLKGRAVPSLGRKFWQSSGVSRREIAELCQQAIHTICMKFCAENSY
jgi:hypothetical protein